MGLCACNSAGHLSNHSEVAPNHAGITFSVSNTLVSFILYYCRNKNSIELLTSWFYLALRG